MTPNGSRVAGGGVRNPDIRPGEGRTRESCLRRAAGALESAGADSPITDALVLTSLAASCTQIELVSDPGAEMSAESSARLDGFVARRAAGEPLARITGIKEFHSLEFETAAGVFLPRFETEGLADLVIEAAREASRKRGGARVLDLCTGSGVIAVTTAVEVPAAEVAAADLSLRAVELAARNARIHGVGSRIEFLVGDLYGAIAGEGRESRFDVIAANPPYVRSMQIPLLAREVRDHDPREALDGGSDGMEAIRRILMGGGRHLRDDGVIIIEIGEDQEEESVRAAEDAGFLSPPRVSRDLAGLPRYLAARKAVHGKAGD